MVRRNLIELVNIIVLLFVCTVDSTSKIDDSGVKRSRWFNGEFVRQQNSLNHVTRDKTKVGLDYI